MIKLKNILTRVSTTAYAAFFYSPLKKGNEESYLFLEPERVHVLNDLQYADDFLSVLDEVHEKKLFAYTILPYELGFLFEKKLRKLLTRKDERAIIGNATIVTFSKKKAKRIRTLDIDFSGIEETKFNISNFKLKESRKSFASKVENIKKQIAEGETYQVNLTSRAEFNFTENVEGLFCDLLLKQSAEYSAFINLPDKNVLSFSPELFFKLEGKSVIAKPMKGTAFRGKNLEGDLITKEELFLSEKNRAENLMIVDLLRNDLGKISKQNSVTVKKLFEVEKYESLFQMVSIIKSRLKEKAKLSDLIKNIFPCGSITGAPKIRTMEIIHQLEKDPRGIYTGSIGLLLPEKSIFNIAIRTVEINKRDPSGDIGLGAGITWGSKAVEEYDEVLSKGAFVTQPSHQFEIFTSLLYEKGKAFLLKEHLDRLKKSAEYFLFYFNREKVEEELNKCFKTLSGKKRYKVKVSINKFGRISIKVNELNTPSINAARVVISSKKIDAQNRFQYFKTTNRKIYDSELTKYRNEGFDEVLFLNQKNNLAEGAITNLFLLLGDKWKTPPISSGILDGIYRNHFIKKHQVNEEPFAIDDLKRAKKIIITNSVRKIITVREIIYREKTIFIAE